MITKDDMVDALDEGMSPYDLVCLLDESEREYDFEGFKELMNSYKHFIDVMVKETNETYNSG